MLQSPIRKMKKRQLRHINKVRLRKNVDWISSSPVSSLKILLLMSLLPLMSRADPAFVYLLRWIILDQQTIKYSEISKGC